MTPETCPNCGGEVPRGARACPECGADERTGWSEDAQVERLGIHDPGRFDYEAFVREEFEGRGGRRRGGVGVIWAVVAIVLLLLLVFALM